MIALRIGLLVVDHITLDEVTPARERLIASGAQITLIIPSGGSILPVTGRYFPAAGGEGVRRSLTQVAPNDFHLVLLPDGLSREQLIGYPEILRFLQGQSCQDEDGGQNMQTPIVMTISYLLCLLDRGAKLDGLANIPCTGMLSGSAWGR